MGRAKGTGPPQLDKLLKRFGTVGTQVALTVTASGVMLLGAAPLVPLWFEHLASADDPVHDLARMWKELVGASPWLHGHTEELAGWLQAPAVQHTAAVRRVAAAYHDVDFLALVSGQPFCGDLLGPLYTSMQSAGEQSARGAFYTPMNVSLMMAEMSQVEEGHKVLDPCCGSGGMLIAAAKTMRKHGKNPSQVLWVANDIDPMAVALCGVNFTAHGMGPHIWLSCGNGLELGFDTEGDPHRRHRPWWEADEEVLRQLYNDGAKPNPAGDELLSRVHARDRLEFGMSADSARLH